MPYSLYFFKLLLIFLHNTFVFLRFLFQLSLEFPNLSYVCLSMLRTLRTTCIHVNKDHTHMVTTPTRTCFLRPHLVEAASGTWPGSVYWLLLSWESSQFPVVGKAFSFRLLDCFRSSHISQVLKTNHLHINYMYVYMYFLSYVLMLWLESPEVHYSLHSSGLA